MTEDLTEELNLLICSGLVESYDLSGPDGPTVIITREAADLLRHDPRAFQDPALISAIYEGPATVRRWLAERLASLERSGEADGA